MRFPREQSMRTPAGNHVRHTRDTRDARGQPSHSFLGVSSARNRFSSIVLRVPGALLLFVTLGLRWLGLQVVVRKIFRKIISGNEGVTVDHATMTESHMMFFVRFFSYSLFSRQPASGQGRGFAHLRSGRGTLLVREQDGCKEMTVARNPCTGTEFLLRPLLSHK
jgi:hypothetical protein